MWQGDGPDMARDVFISYSVKDKATAAGKLGTV
jgi:hypothetical protein